MLKKQLSTRIGNGMPFHSLKQRFNVFKAVKECDELGGVIVHWEASARIWGQITAQSCKETSRTVYTVVTRKENIRYLQGDVCLEMQGSRLSLLRIVDTHDQVITVEAIEM